MVDWNAQPPDPWPHQYSPCRHLASCSPPSQRISARTFERQTRPIWCYFDLKSIEQMRHQQMLRNKIMRKVPWSVAFLRSPCVCAINDFRSN